MNRLNGSRAAALALALAFAPSARAAGVERLAGPSGAGRSRSVPAVSLPRFTTERGTPALFRAGFFPAAVLGPNAVSPGADIPALPPSAMTGSESIRQGAAALSGDSGLRRAPLILSAKGEEISSSLHNASRRSGSDEEAALSGRKISDALLETFEPSGSPAIGAAAAAGADVNLSREASRLQALRKIVSAETAYRRPGQEPAGPATPVSQARSGFAETAKAGAGSGQGVPLIVLKVFERGLVLSYASAGLRPAGRLTQEAISRAASAGGIDLEGGRAVSARLDGRGVTRVLRSGRHPALQLYARTAGAVRVPGAIRTSDAELFSFGESAAGLWTRGAFMPAAGRDFSRDGTPFGSGGARAVLPFLPLLAAAVLAGRKVRY